MSTFSSTHFVERTNNVDSQDSGYLSGPFEEDEEHQKKHSLFMKRMFGAPLETDDLLAEDLVSNKHLPSNLSAPPSIISDFSENAELADIKFLGFLLTDKNAMPRSLIHSSVELPDGTRAISKQMNNAYFEAYNSHPAFHEDHIDHDLFQCFLDQACEINTKTRFMTAEAEAKLNANCLEQSNGRHRSPRGWHIDFEDRPIATNKQPVIKELYRHGHIAKTFTDHLLVRDDLPLNPHHFALTSAGRKAARALYTYQTTSEGQQTTLLHPYDVPTLANNIPITHSTNPNAHLQANPGINDRFTSTIIKTITSLVAHEDDFAFMAEHHEAHVGWASGHPLNGDEDEVVRDIYNDLRTAPGEFSTELLFRSGFVVEKDAFGDEAPHLRARLLWWREKRGVDGVEAIVRFHCERARAYGAPQRMMTVYEEWNLNYGSSDARGERSAVTTTGPEVFAELHAAEVDWSQEHLKRWVGQWAAEEVAAPGDVFEHDVFVPGGDEEDELACDAFDALVAYQDSVEPMMEPRGIPEWARPRWVEAGLVNGLTVVEEGEEDVEPRERAEVGMLMPLVEQMHAGMHNAHDTFDSAIWKPLQITSIVSTQVNTRPHVTPARNPPSPPFPQLDSNHFPQPALPEYQADQQATIAALVAVLAPEEEQDPELEPDPVRPPLAETILDFLHNLIEYHYSRRKNKAPPSPDHSDYMITFLEQHYAADLPLESEPWWMPSLPSSIVLEDDYECLDEYIRGHFTVA